MRTLNRPATLANLLERQSKIEFESPEDEGAAEHWAEYQSVILAIKAGYPDSQILEAIQMLSMTEIAVQS